MTSVKSSAHRSVNHYHVFCCQSACVRTHSGGLAVTQEGADPDSGGVCVDWSDWLLIITVSCAYMCVCCNSTLRRCAKSTLALAVCDYT